MLCLCGSGYPPCGSEFVRWYKSVPCKPQKLCVLFLGAFTVGGNDECPLGERVVRDQVGYLPYIAHIYLFGGVGICCPMIDWQ